MCTLFDRTLDSFDVNMTIVFHPTHSPMPLHIQMIINNDPQFLQPHQY
jgi:hypothetical protein